MSCSGDTQIELNLEHGISVFPPLESGMAKFNIFATNQYRGERSIYDADLDAEGEKQDLSSRYDFCDLGESDFVHILALLSFKGHDNDISFFLLVADMCLSEKQSTSFPNDLYTYKTVQSLIRRSRGTGKTLTKSPIINCIRIDTVVAPCCFTKLHSKPNEAESVLNNVFVLFDIKYCDRSGWHSTTSDHDGVNTSADGRIQLLSNDEIAYFVRINDATNEEVQEDDDNMSDT